MKTWYFIAILLVIPVKQSFADEPGLIKAAGMGDITTVLKYLERGMSIELSDQKGKTALIAASQHGHTALVKLLLDKGASVNAKTSDNTTAFYYAAQNHHIESLKLLHAKGADLNIINRFEFSPLSVAIIANRDEKIVRLLLDFGANPDIQPIGSPLITEAIAKNSIGIVRLLINKGANVNATNEIGVTPLMIAAASHQMDAVKLLLKKGAKIRVRDGNNKNILHWLLCSAFYDNKNENISLLKLLLKNGADFDVQAKSLVGYKDGSTPLMCAVKRDFQKSVKVLLTKKANLDFKNSEGHTALYYAVDENNVAMVRVLLSHGANPELEDELKIEARLSTDIGRMLLAAMQPSLEANPGECPEYKEQLTKISKRLQPVVKLNPLKSQNFPLAHVEGLKIIPPVGQNFSLSPDGKWLVVREDHTKTPQVKSRRLIVYDIVNQKTYFFSPKIRFSVDEDSWLFDSSRYVVGDYRKLIIDVSNGRPQLRTLSKSSSWDELLYAGGDSCPWRDDKGQVVLARPDRDDRKLIWSANGKVVYSLQASGVDEYYLVAQRGRKTKKLIRHSARWLRDHDPFFAEMDKHSAPAAERAKFEKFKKMILEIPIKKLTASQFSLSPNGRYLYYRIGQAGGPGFFGLPDRNIVVDLKSTPVKVWYINRSPWGTPQWHPNGHDLYFIDQNKNAQPDPDFPPMRQPGRWGVSVVYFPGN